MIAMPAFVTPNAIADQATSLGEMRASSRFDVPPQCLDTIAVLLDGSLQTAAALAPARALAARLDATLALYWLDLPAPRAARVPTPARGVHHRDLQATALEWWPGQGEQHGPVAHHQGPGDRSVALDPSHAGRGGAQMGEEWQNASGSNLDAAVELARAQGLRVRARRLPLAEDVSMNAAVRRVLGEIEPGLLVLAGRQGCCRVGGALGSAARRLAQALVAEPRLPLLFVPPHYGFRTGDGAAQWIGWEQVVLDAVRAGRPLAPLPVMVALDGSAAAEHTLSFAAALARGASARLSLVHVVAAVESGSSTPRDELAAAGAALDYLRQMVARLQATGLPPATVRTAVRIGSVADQLLLQAAHERAAILMLARGGSHRPWPAGHRGLALQILQRASLPVLIIPAAAPLCSMP